MIHVIKMNNVLIISVVLIQKKNAKNVKIINVLIVMRKDV